MQTVILSINFTSLNSKIWGVLDAGVPHQAFVKTELLIIDDADPARKEFTFLFIALD